MSVNSPIQYTDAIDYGFNAPYDGIDIKPDRQSGWNVRTRLLGEWITAIPDRGLADRVHAALLKVEEKTRKELYKIEAVASELEETKETPKETLEETQKEILEEKENDPATVTHA